MHAVADALGAALPLAVAIALSPLPVITVSLLLTSDRGVWGGALFVLSRIATLAALLAAVVLLADRYERIMGINELPPWVMVCLGSALLLVGAAQLRPRRGRATTSPPRWISAINSRSPWRPLGLGALVTITNGKELSLIIAAAASISSRTLHGSERLMVVLVLALLGSLSALAPLLATAAAPHAVTPRLVALRDWLTLNATLVMGLLFVVIGAVVAGHGIAAI